MKKSLHDLVGHRVEHIIFGECEIIEVTNIDEGKFIGKILKDNSTKKLIFSRNYYRDIEDYESIDLPVYVKKKKRTFSEPDPSKYRRHPLVKSVDWKLSRQRQKMLDHDLIEDYDEDDE